METIDERTFKEKFKDWKGRVKIKFEDTVKWCKENPIPTAAIATATAATVKTGYKIVKAVINATEEKRSRNSVYCNDIQANVRLKHELNYNEARELRDRMDEGQTKFEALDQMGLLKK